MMLEPGRWRHDRRFRVGLAGVALAVLAFTGGAPRAMQQRPDSKKAREVSIHESSARRLATTTVLPEFPAGSLRRRTHGVAVVELVFGVDGVVRSARSLQGPDDACRDATVRAVRQWRFRPVQGPNHEPAEVTAKLTFYFEITADGKGVVSDGGLPSGGLEKVGAGRLAGEIDADGVAKLVAEGGLLVIDVRPRELSRSDPAQGAAAIPFDEISTRAREFTRIRSVVVVCYPRFETLCDAAAREILDYTNVGRVFTLPQSPRKGR